MRIRFAVISVVVLLSIAHSQDRKCSEYAAPPDAKKFVYCESFLLGRTQDSGQKQNSKQIQIDGFRVSLESKFFAGLKRVKKHGTFRFEKNGHEIFDYPASLTVYIEKGDIALVQSSGQAFKTQMPRQVIVRWFGPSHQLIAESTADVEQAREAWPELRAPRTWYRGNINNSKVVPLTSEMEISVIGNKGEVLGTIMRSL